MKKLPLILFIAVLSLMFSCGKIDPTPSLTTGNTGSWSYKGTTYKGTSSMWAGYLVESLADKPHSSTLQADFSSNSPSSGNYTITSTGDVTTSSQVAISLVDSTLPSPMYISAPSNAGTVSVSRKGSSVTVTVTNVLLIGYLGSNADSLVVTGTIIK